MLWDDGDNDACLSARCPGGTLAFDLSQAVGLVNRLAPSVISVWVSLSDTQPHVWMSLNAGRSDYLLIYCTCFHKATTYVCYVGINYQGVCLNM